MIPKALGLNHTPTTQFDPSFWRGSGCVAKIRLAAARITNYGRQGEIIVVAAAIAAALITLVALITLAALVLFATTFIALALATVNLVGFSGF
jgi:hypothetical protein